MFTDWTPQRIATRSDDPTTRIGWLILLMHLVVWTVVPAIVNTNVTFDTVEMWYWGQHSSWGYSKHPPLPALCAGALTDLFGNQVWVLYLAAQCAVVVAFWGVWKLARRWLTPWAALMSFMLLEVCYFFNWKTVQLNNNTLNLPWWALSALAFHSALTRGRRRDWIATGVLLAVGMYTKYDIAFLAMSMVFLLLVLPEARRHWRTAGPYLTMATALVLITPHLVWLAAADFPTFEYAMYRSQHEGGLIDHVINPAAFAAAQSAAFLPAAAVLWPVFGWRWKRREGVADGQLSLSRALVLTIGLGPFAMYLLLSAATGAKLAASWGSPIWMFWPLLLLTCFEPTRDAVKQRWAMYRTAIVAAVIPIVFVAHRHIGPHITQKGNHVIFPGQEVATAIQNAWHDEYRTSLPRVGGEWWLAGNAAFYSDDLPDVYGDLDPRVSPWTSDDGFRKSGGMLVWFDDDDDGKPPPTWQARFPNMKSPRVIELSYRTSAKILPIRLGMAILPPASAILPPVSATKLAEKPDRAEKATELANKPDQLWR
jgi:4-amino-4-deoxy-L-arabinose transferase-like glycosyltransferase